MVGKLYSEIFGKDSSEAVKTKDFPMENYMALVKFCQTHLTSAEFVVLMRCLDKDKSQNRLAQELGVTRQAVNANYHGAIEKLIRQKDRIRLFLMPISEWIERLETLTVQNLELGRRNALQEAVIYSLTTQQKEEDSTVGKLLETDVGKIGLSVRSENGLRRLGARTVRGMLGLTNSEIIRSRGLGIKSYNEILSKTAEVLAKYPELVEITNLKRP